MCFLRRFVVRLIQHPRLKNYQTDCKHTSMNTSNKMSMGTEWRPGLLKKYCCSLLLLAQVLSVWLLLSQVSDHQYDYSRSLTLLVLVLAIKGALELYVRFQHGDQAESGLRRLNQHNSSCTCICIHTGMWCAECVLYGMLLLTPSLPCCLA